MARLTNWVLERRRQGKEDFQRTISSSSVDDHVRSKSASTSISRESYRFETIEWTQVLLRWISTAASSQNPLQVVEGESKGGHLERQEETID
jgi:hypothetical protein